jgi:hypothetical protein
MLQEIGIMVGGYIIVRMLQIAIPAKDGKENSIVQVFAILLLCVVLIFVGDMVVRGFGASADLSRFLK